MRTREVSRDLQAADRLALAASEVVEVGYPQDDPRLKALARELRAYRRRRIPRRVNLEVIGE